MRAIFAEHRDSCVGFFQSRSAVAVFTWRLTGTFHATCPSSNAATGLPLCILHWPPLPTWFSVEATEKLKATGLLLPPETDSWTPTEGSDSSAG